MGKEAGAFLSGGRAVEEVGTETLTLGKTRALQRTRGDFANGNGFREKFNADEFCI